MSRAGYGRDGISEAGFVTEGELVREVWRLLSQRKFIDSGLVFALAERARPGLSDPGVPWEVTAIAGHVRKVYPKARPELVRKFCETAVLVPTDRPRIVRHR